MGYSYDMKTKKLCCDCCGTAGARKRKCPHGWCPPPALCKKCNDAVRADGRWEKSHCGCEKSAKVWSDRKAVEADKLNRGEYVRRSAIKAGNLTHVVFRDKSGNCIGKFMTDETYCAIPIMTPASVSDFEKIGALMDAPNVFQNGRVTKEATAEEVLA